MKTSLLITLAVLALVGCAGVTDICHRNRVLSSSLATIPEATTARDILRAIESEPVYQKFQANVTSMAMRPGKSITMVKDFHHNRTYGALFLLSSSNLVRVMFVPVHQFGATDVHAEDITLPVGADSEVWQLLDEMNWRSLPSFISLRSDDESSSAPFFLSIRADDIVRHHVVTYGQHDARYAELLRQLANLVPNNRFWGKYKMLVPLPADKLDTRHSDEAEGRF
jgi:hypothetical protein